MITDPALGGVQNDSLQTNLVAGEMSSFKPIKRKSIQNDEYEITELKIKSESRTKNIPPLIEEDQNNVGPGQYDPSTTYTKK